MHAGTYTDIQGFGIRNHIASPIAETLDGVRSRLSVASASLETVPILDALQASYESTPPLLEVT